MSNLLHITDSNGDTIPSEVVIAKLKNDLASMTAQRDELQAKLTMPDLARNQPCGCVVCHCYSDDRCHGCGAKMCDDKEHCVFKDSDSRKRIVYQDEPTYLQLRDELKKLKQSIQIPTRCRAPNMSQLRFEKHTDKKWNVFVDESGGYVGSIWNDGTFLASGTRILTADELRQIAAELDRLNAEREGGK